MLIRDHLSLLVGAKKLQPHTVGVCSYFFACYKCLTWVMSLFSAAMSSHHISSRYYEWLENRKWQPVALFLPCHLPWPMWSTFEISAIQSTLWRLMRLCAQGGRSKYNQAKSRLFEQPIFPVLLDFCSESWDAIWPGVPCERVKTSAGRKEPSRKPSQRGFVLTDGWTMPLLWSNLFQESLKYLDTTTSEGIVLNIKIL